ESVCHVAPESVVRRMAPPAPTASSSVRVTQRIARQSAAAGSGLSLRDAPPSDVTSTRVGPSAIPFSASANETDRRYPSAPEAVGASTLPQEAPPSVVRQIQPSGFMFGPIAIAVLASSITTSSRGHCAKTGGCARTKVSARQVAPPSVVRNTSPLSPTIIPFCASANDRPLRSRIVSVARPPQVWPPSAVVSTVKPWLTTA